jgi:hypothetical protein
MGAGSRERRAWRDRCRGIGAGHATADAETAALAGEAVVGRAAGDGVH